MVGYPYVMSVIEWFPERLGLFELHPQVLLSEAKLGFCYETRSKQLWAELAVELLG